MSPWRSICQDHHRFDGFPTIDRVFAVEPDASLPMISLQLLILLFVHFFSGVTFPFFCIDRWFINLVIWLVIAHVVSCVGYVGDAWVDDGIRICGGAITARLTGGVLWEQITQFCHCF